MKPSDHPEFFRFPPPEGRSRESTIVLSKDGRFFHEGAPVEHPGMKKAFASWLSRHPDDGRDILSNGYDWTYLTVEGARAFVQSVRSVAGRPELTLLDGRELPLDAPAVSCDADGRVRRLASHPQRSWSWRPGWSSTAARSACRSPGSSRRLPARAPRSSAGAQP